MEPASAIALAALGCTVTVAGGSVHTLIETVGLIGEAGGNARYAVCDVSDEASVRDAVAIAVGESGRLHFGVSSAGVSGGDNVKKTADYSTEFFDQIIAIGLRGTFLSMKYELQQMRSQGFRSIVNIASGASLVGVPGFSGYTAAMHGVIGLTKTAALDDGADGIAVAVHSRNLAHS
jgi:NAD(P)-dependent dehydrogenase (short-subunit alcohol dehydrogenase family)